MIVDIDGLLVALLSEHRAQCDAPENKYECPTIRLVAEARAEVGSLYERLDAANGAAKLKDEILRDHGVEWWQIEDGVKFAPVEETT